MKPQIALVLVGFMSVFNQSATAQAQVSTRDTTVEIPNGSVGQECEIVLKSKTAASMESDVGTIVRFDDMSVVLSDSTRTVQVERRVPILASIPFISGWFRNVSVGVEKVPGELKISRSEIESLKFASQIE